MEDRPKLTNAQFGMLVFLIACLAFAAIKELLSP